MEGSFAIYDHSMVIKSPNSAISYEQEEGDVDHIYGVFINENRDVVDKFIENYKTLTKKEDIDVEITTEKQNTSQADANEVTSNVDANEVTSQDLTKQSVNVEITRLKITVDGNDEDRKTSIISLMYLCGIKPENLDDKCRWPLMHLIHKGLFNFMH